MKKLFSIVSISILLVACAATGTGRVSECFEIINGGASLNLSGGVTVTGFCIKRLNNACPELVDCKAGWYIDSNDNGKMDPGEPHDIDSEANPGNEFCQGQVTINQASQYAGKTLRWNLEAFEKDAAGNKTTLKSTGGSYKLPG